VLTSNKKKKHDKETYKTDVLVSAFLRLPFLCLITVFFIAKASASSEIPLLPIKVQSTGWVFTPKKNSIPSAIQIGVPLERILDKSVCCAGKYQTEIDISNLRNLPVALQDDIGILLPETGGLTSVAINNREITVPQADYTSIGTVIPITHENILQGKIALSIQVESTDTNFTGMWKDSAKIDTTQNLILIRDKNYIYQKIVPIFLAIILIIFAVIFNWIRNNPQIHNPIYREYFYGFVCGTIQMLFLSGIPRVVAPQFSAIFHYPLAGVAMMLAGFRIVCTYANISIQKINAITGVFILLMACQATCDHFRIFQILGPINLFLVNVASLFAILFLIRVPKGAQDKSFIILAIIYNISNFIDSGHLLAYVIGENYPIPYLMRITTPLFLFMGLLYLAKNLLIELTNSQKTKLLNEHATQVSHDIRSPLAALEMISGSLSELADEKRFIIVDSINRIRDIANDLLNKDKEKPTLANRDVRSRQTKGEGASVALMGPVIDTIVTEKRLQFRNQINTHIEFSQINASFGLFADIRPNEFKRVLSNLIDNSVESLTDQRGLVEVALQISTVNSRELQVKIKDDGKGIDKNFLKIIGNRGETLGKPNGSGLGVFHAKETVKNAGGKLVVESELNEGTMVTITLPRSNAPDWFLPEIALFTGQIIVIFDDDQAIHQIWKRRFEALNRLEPLSILNFSSSEELRKYYSKNFSDLETALFLMDYHISGQSETGLDVIEKLGIQKQSILVTSWSEDTGVRERCKKLGVKLIPKSMSGFVPITITEDKS